MSDSLTLAMIEQKTGVPMVRLRYIADSEILPGNRLQKAAAPRRPGRGVTRHFLPSEALGMVIANALVTSAAVCEESIDHPTTLRKNVSSTTAQYTLPS